MPGDISLKPSRSNTSSGSRQSCAIDTSGSVSFLSLSLSRTHIQFANTCDWVQGRSKKKPRKGLPLYPHVLPPRWRRTAPLDPQSVISLLAATSTFVCLSPYQNPGCAPDAPLIEAFSAIHFHMIIQICCLLAMLRFAR